jgi:hypothetical protein
MADAFSIKFDDASVQAALTELGEKASEITRPAAQAGTQVLYDEVTSNVSRIGRKTGNLAASIYQVYSVDNSSPTNLPRELEREEGAARASRRERPHPDPQGLRRQRRQVVHEQDAASDAQARRGAPIHPAGL